MYANNDVEALSKTEVANEEKELRSGVKWISFKQKFFSYVLVSKDSFNDAFVELHTKARPSNSRYQKSMSSVIDIPFDGLNEDNRIEMSYYHEKTEKATAFGDYLLGSRISPFMPSL